MSLISWMVGKYRGLPALSRTLLHAVASFVVFYGGAIAENKIQADWSAADLGPFFVKSIVVLAMFLVFVVFGYLFSQQLDHAEQHETQRKRQLAYAASLMDQFVSKQIAALSKSADAPSLEDIFADAGRIKIIVECVYQCFESQYGDSEKIESKVEFEVTFMTMSYVDKAITIPAYANRAGRAPQSMLKRKEDPNVYANSITAMAYADKRPVIRLFEDTADPAVSYVELYPGQKQRIRSSVVYPVLSEQNSLLGTLVVHCNRPGFFKRQDEKFWSDLLEVFARRLALEKVRLDFVCGRKLVGSGLPF